MNAPRNNQDLLVYCFITWKPIKQCPISQSWDLIVAEKDSLILTTSMDGWNI